MKQFTTLSNNQVNILYAFRNMTERFIDDGDKLYAVVDDGRIELKEISDEMLPTLLD